MEHNNILEEVYRYIGKFVIYPSEQARVAHTLWIVGSYFTENVDITVFDNYPILAFLSPDEDSGKSRALDVTETLAYNAINGGSYTAASLCREIDQRFPTMITMILDELDEIFVSGKDNSDYIRLLNNGYQRGKYIVRASLTKDGENIKTMSYCPKAIAGLTTTKLKKTTRSRMIIIRMRPMKKGERVERHLDKIEGQRILELIGTWAPTVIEKLKTIEEDGLSNLSNRAAQIWHPLLALSKIAGGEEWFKRASEAAQYFTNKQKPEDNLGKKLLKELYRCYLMPKEYPKNIRGTEFEGELYGRGFNVEKSTVSYCLGANGYGIPISQIKRASDTEHPNQNGYIWDDCIPFFADHLTEEERTEINNMKVETTYIPVPLPASTFYQGERVGVRRGRGEQDTSSFKEFRKILS